MAQDAADRLIAEGNRAEDGGDPAKACALYQRATELAPGYARANINLGIGLEAVGNAAAAIAAYERALAADPSNPAANYNLGKLLYSRGEPARAEPLLRQALDSRPDFPDARLVYAYVLQAAGKLDAANAQLRHALLQRPDDVTVRAELFHVLEAQGDLAGAAAEPGGVRPRKPDWTQALYNYGTTLMRLGRDADAEAALRRVLAREPRFVLAYPMLGNLLHRHGRVREIIELCRTGRAALPANFDLESFELLELNFVDDLSEGEVARAHRAFGARLERAFPPRAELRRERGARERRLRIGYVSSDFSYPPVGLFVLPAIERHDRSRFEVYCYATSTKADDFTRRLSSRADAWRDAHAQSEEQLAQLVHEDRIDVLVDLAGHSGVFRLGACRVDAPPEEGRR